MKPDWHPFPKEVPPAYGDYLISTDAGRVLTSAWGIWDEGNQTFAPGWKAWHTEFVVAWAVPPAPYQP